MIKKVIFWGMGNDYELALNQIYFEICKGTLTVEAIVCQKSDKYCSSKDGFPVITKADLENITFDYLIILSNKYYEDIKQEALEAGIAENKIIHGQVFRLPLFDFGRYVKLLENPITILSDDCWGGMAYHRLYLPVTSPLFNILWYAEDFSRFIQNPFYYLNTDFQMIREGDLKRGIWPIAQLGSHGDYVKMNLVHNETFQEAKEQWEKRKQRINPDNIFVKMGIPSMLESNMSEAQKEQAIHVFRSIPYPKILSYCNTPIPKLDSRFTINPERFLWLQRKSKIIYNFNFNDYFREKSFYDLDLLKLLTGEQNSSRYWKKQQKG